MTVNDGIDRLRRQPATAGPTLFEREARVLTTETGEQVPYEIGALVVPEVRGDPSSRMIRVGFARIPSQAGAGALPTFHLAGGPGSSHLGALDPRTEAERMKLRELLPYRAVGDVVILDQRGYSQRGEVLGFSIQAGDVPLDRPACRAAATDAFVEVARAAVAANPGRDLSGYNVLECADDVNDLRVALGYSRIILVGQSFGSQWSLAVMRRHPGLVARAMMSGLEPLDHAYDMPSHIFAALQRLAWDADRDPRLAPWLPAGGLMEAVRAIRARLALGPVAVVVRDEVGRQEAEVVLGAEDFQQVLLRPAEVWPATILSIYHTHYEAWARDVVRGRRRGDGKDALIKPLIDTSLGVTPAREHLLRTDPAGDLLGWWDFDAYAASAAAWPSPDVGDSFRTPVLDSTPVVFISGDWDIATPIENMLGLLPYFPNSRAVLVHRGPHAARAILAERRSPVIDAVLEFLRTGELHDLPVSVDLPVPQFDLPDFPAPAPSAP